MIKNIFDKHISDEIINRIQQLNPTTQPNWGKMSVDQMLAHCNVTYKYTYEPEQFKKPNFLMKLMLKNFVKKIVVSEKPYEKNGRTAPEFVMTEAKDFEKEKAILINNINKTQQLGSAHFDGKENFSFGNMTSQEWNNMFYKHLNHHLTQFGV
jgi:hypothetical protein